MMTDNEKLDAAQFVANVAMSRASRARDRAELEVSLQSVFEALGGDAAAVVPKAIVEIRRRIAHDASLEQKRAGRVALEVLERSLPGATKDPIH